MIIVNKMTKVKLPQRHERVLERIKVLLTRSFSLVHSTANGVSATEALLIIRSDVAEMGRIFQQHQDIFLQPRVHLLAHKRDPDWVLSPLLPIKNEDQVQVSACPAVFTESVIPAASLVTGAPLETGTLVIPQAPVIPTDLVIPSAPVIKSEPGLDLNQSNLANQASVQPDGGDVMEDTEMEAFDDAAGHDFDDIPDPPTSGYEVPEESANDTKPWALPSTHNSFSSDEEMHTEDHEKNQKSIRPNGCYVCRKTVVQKLDKEEVKKKKRLAHMVRYHPEKVFVCDCGMQILQEGDIQAHFDQHPDGTINKLIPVPSCTSCGLLFLSPRGRMSKCLKYYWVRKGDVKFVANHLATCQRKTRKIIVKCPSCQMKFPQKQRLRHFLEKHPREVKQCKKCGDWVEADQVKEHERHRHRLPERKLKEKELEKERQKNLRTEIFCTYCDKAVSVPKVEKESDAQRVHAIEAHSAEILKCECGEYLWTKNDRDHHLQDHPTMTQQPVRDLMGITSCPTCELKFLDELGNLTPIAQYFVFTGKDESFAQSHADQCQTLARFRQPRKCPKCGFETRRFMMLAHHLDSHRTLMRKCNLCHYWLPKWNLGPHYNKHGVYKQKKKREPNSVNVDKEEFSFICPHCGKIFHSEKKYNMHIRRHHGAEKDSVETLVSCSFCGQEVKNSEISKHEMEHIRKGKIYNCSVCGKGLPYKTWVRHESACKKLATKGRPPKQECHLCLNSYTELAAHIARVHEKRERFPCKQCGKTFAEPRFLERHETIHTKVCKILMTFIVYLVKNTFEVKAES